MSARQAAARFGVGISSAIRWIARAKLGELTPRPQGRRRASSLDVQEASIVGLIGASKDITLNEIVDGGGRSNPETPLRLVTGLGPSAIRGAAQILR
jgi:transposase